MGLRGLELPAKHAVASGQPVHTRRSAASAERKDRGSAWLRLRYGQLRATIPSNRSLASESAATILRSNVAERQHYPERTGIRAPLERYCALISGARGAPRSCPAGSIAEVGLRECGATPRNRTEDLKCQSLQKSDRWRQRQPPFQRQNHRDTVLAILSRRGRGELLSWLMFVASGVGPYSGQLVHFKVYAPDKIEYAINRYAFETQRRWWRTIHSRHQRAELNRALRSLRLYPHVQRGHCRPLSAGRNRDAGNRRIVCGGTTE